MDNKYVTQPEILHIKVKQGRMEHVVEDLELVRKVLQRSGGSIPGRGHSTCTGPGCLGNREESCVAGGGAGAGATLAFSPGKALGRGAAGPDSGAHQHSLAAVEGIDCGDTQGEQVTALVWMDDSELD